MTPEVWAAVYRRDRRCVRCGGEGWQVHHRKLRSQGGQDVLPNLILMCRACHDTVHSRRAEVGEPGGFIVPSWNNPEGVAVEYHGRGWVWLTSAGGLEGLGSE